jgi:hypothetical protein
VLILEFSQNEFYSNGMGFFECALFGGMCIIWNVLNLECAQFVICYCLNVRKLECALVDFALFRMCSFWNVSFLECALECGHFGMYSFWNALKMECALFGM